MDIGVVLQTTPPSAVVVDLATRAETFGSACVWTFDSHILWQEPFPIYTQILANTRNVTVGPMVTNPHAGLDRHRQPVRDPERDVRQPHGDRPRCDSAVRVINGKPSTLVALAEAVHVIRELVNGREVEYRGSTIRFPWASKSRTEVWVLRTEGPEARPGKSATGSSCSSPTPTSRRGRSAPCGGRPRKPVATRRHHDLCPSAYVGDDVLYARDQCRWFGAWSATTWRTS